MSEISILLSSDSTQRIVCAPDVLDEGETFAATPTQGTVRLRLSPEGRLTSIDAMRRTQRIIIHD